MKKFRLIIRIIFLIYIAFSVLIGLNDEMLIKEGFSFLWSKGVFTFYENMKTWALIGFVIIVIQFTLENIQIISLKGKLKDKEEEVIQLKAKLYDENSEQKAMPAKELEEKKEGEDTATS